MRPVLSKVYNYIATLYVCTQNALTTSQDKAFRRISELKEQIQLDQLAKQHLEDNYRLMMEEKDELLKVLQTQVCYHGLS